ncbi:MAG TPA: hypothetical protein PLI18_15415 [Pirellulaceae bacterium]|nr:hypothetical protein [Pirellulaceae bacterium]
MVPDSLPLRSPDTSALGSSALGSTAIDIIAACSPVARELARAAPAAISPIADSPISPEPLDRRRFLHRAAAALAIAGSGTLATAGCSPRSSTEADAIIGRIGIGAGRFQKPRALAIDSTDRLFVVDMTGRIQSFDPDGRPLALWRTPDIHQGKPTGLTISPEGHLWVADTHYFRILEYTADGTLLPERTLGGTNGTAPGEFGLVTDVAVDSTGCRYVSEYGEFDRIQKFAPDGSFVIEWGGHGKEPGKFLRPQSLAIDEQDRVWVADACNHRVQLFDLSSGKVELVHSWGMEGTAPGELRYPYGLILVDDTVVLAEYGNHRVQQLTRDGEPIAIWGRAGRGSGELDQPWSVARDSRGRYFVLDSYNHRIQRFRFGREG